MLWKLYFIIIYVLNSITQFDQKMENKNILWKWSLINRESHLSLERLTSRMAHAKRERESTPAKQRQGKAWATKAQQDLPVNVVINSRLLACKPYEEELYLYVIPMLRVGPNFFEF
jgi:hypothetical protein